MSKLPPAIGTIIKLVKYNCTKSNRKNVFPKKPSCTVELSSFVCWKMMLFAKIRKLMASALWMQAMLKTRFMF